MRHDLLIRDFLVIVLNKKLPGQRVLVWSVLLGKHIVMAHCLSFCLAVNNCSRLRG